MKITKIEKIVLGIIFILICGVVVNLAAMHQTIKTNGGLKQMIISVGKEIKGIKTEIGKE